MGLTLAKMKCLPKRKKTRQSSKVQIIAIAPISGRTLVDRALTAPPAAKKRKTGPASDKDAPEVVSDEEEEEEDEGPEEGSGEEAVPVEDEEDEDGEGESAEEGVEATAKSGGPAASAKAAKGSVVPKEDDLEEVKGDSE